MPATARRPLDGVDAGVGRVITFEGGNTVNLLDTFLMGPYLDGTQPFARSQRVDRVREDATLLPPDTKPSRSAVVDGTTAHLVLGDGWTLLLSTLDQGGGHVEVVAATDELARTVLEQATDGAAEELEQDDPRVEIGFWHLGRQPCPAPGAAHRGRAVAGHPAQLRRFGGRRLRPAGRARRNSRSTAGFCLCTARPVPARPRRCGRWPKQWRDWCQLDFVVDPERLFVTPVTSSRWSWAATTRSRGACCCSRTATS